MEATRLIEILNTYGVRTAITAPIIYALYYLSKSKIVGKIANKLMNRIIDKISNDTKKEADTNIKNSDIENHHIFNKMNNLLYRDIYTVDFGEDTMNILMRDYLSIIIKEFKVGIKVFVNKGDYIKMTPTEYTSELNRVINEILCKIDREVENRSLPVILVDNMKLKTITAVNFFMEITAGIASSHHYENNLIKTFSILNILSTVLDNLITKSSIKVADFIYEDLKGISYKGKIIR